MGLSIYLPFLVVMSLQVLQSDAQYCVPLSCASPGSNFAYLPSDHTKDYLYIGGLFAVHEQGSSPYECGSIRHRGIQNLEAFLWATRTYKNRYPNSVLQTVQVGAFAFDSCKSSKKAIQQILNLETCEVAYGSPPIEPSRVLAWVGPDNGEEALQVAPLLSGMKKTMISPAATDPALSDKLTYPYFLRTVPPDTEQALAMVSVLRTNAWMKVQLVYTNNTYGLSGADVFRQTAKAKGICIVYEEAISVTAQAADLGSTIDNLLDNSETRAVVVYTEAATARLLLQAAHSKNTRGIFSWIGTNSWGTDFEVVENVQNTAEGAVTFSLEQQTLGLDDFLDYWKNLKPGDNAYNPWFKEYWMDVFRCDLPNEAVRYNIVCDTATQSLEDVPMDLYVPYTIKAVDAIVNALEDARADQCQNSQSLCTDFINNMGKWDIIHDAIAKVNVENVIAFNTATGDTSMGKQLVSNYRAPHDNCAQHCYTQIGYYSREQGQVELTQYVFSYDADGARLLNATSECPGSPCTQCGEVATAAPPLLPTSTQPAVNDGGDQEDEGPPLKLREGTWVITLMVLAGLGILMTLGMEVYLSSKIVCTPYVKHWRTMWLGQLLLFGVFLCYLTLFAFVPSPTRVTCGLLRFGVGVSFCMCYAIMLVKLMIVLSSKNVGYLKGIFQVLMFFFAWGVQIVIDVQWMILRPPRVILDETQGWICEETFETHITSLVYVMFLIFICTLIAIKTHGIITNHREGIFIGLVCGFTIPVWIAWILLGILNTDKAYRDPVMAFGLFLTATLILFVMFLPKVRQLNSMGVEGIYAEDDAPDGYAASVLPPPSIIATHTHIPAQAPSIIAGSVVQAPAKPPSIVYVNGGVYSEPPVHKPTHYHYQTDHKHRPRADALYLKHPGTSTLQSIHKSASIRSAPSATHLRPRPQADQVFANTRVLRVTSELSGRSYPDGKKLQSESNYNVQYSTLQPGDTAQLQVQPIQYATLQPNGTARSRASSTAGTLKSDNKTGHRSLQELGSL